MSPKVKKGRQKRKPTSKKHKVVVEEEASPLNVPKIEELPCFSDILTRTEEKGVVMEDLDTLQLELETLLSSVVVRGRSMMMERDKTSGQKKKTQSKEISKSVKKAKEGKSPIPIKFPGVKPVTEHTLPDSSKLEAPKILLPQNDTPHKYWSFVESYCTDIKPEDISLLDALIKEHEDDSEYQEIPPLGEHWTKKYMQEEQDAGSGCPASRVKMPRREESVLHLGPLKQLVSALEEDAVVPPRNTNRGRVSGNENESPSSCGNFASAAPTEKSEQEAQGLQDVGEQVEEDEILSEMKRCQDELKVLSAHNLKQLKLLKQSAIEEMQRQELKKKLDVVDNEICEVSRRIQSSKLKKEPVDEKDRDLAVRLLKERNDLIMLIDQ